MSTLFVAATNAEMQCLCPGEDFVVGELRTVKNYSYLVYGIGAAIAATYLSAQLALQKWDLVVCVGIGGAFLNSGLSIGDCVVVNSDTQGDPVAKDKCGGKYRL